MLTRPLYTLLLTILLPLVPLKLLWRAIRQPDYLQHWGERFGFYSPLTPHPSPLIWLHCVSVGETRAAAPLIALLQQHYPKHQILITHGTPTGRAASEQLFGGKVMRAYLPYDLPFAVNRFLQHFKPNIGLLMETELWFNLIELCKTRNIPLLLVNARLSEKSARGYAKLSNLSQQALRDLRTIAAQTNDDADRLIELGARDISVIGNLKFDVTPPADVAQQGAHLRQLLGTDRPVFLAASTRDGEEALILDAVATVNIPDLLTVIVPRHPQRFDEVARLIEKRGLSFVRRSALSLRLPGKREREGNEEAPQTVQPPVRQGADEEADKVIVNQEVSIVLGDSMGELFSYYAACDVTFIGGSLLPYGGQNLIEACALGKPVILGTHTFNFEDAAGQAIQRGAARRVENTQALAHALQDLMTDASKRNHMGTAGLGFAKANRGAAARALALVARVI